MKAKKVYESIDDVLKPKDPKDILAGVQNIFPNNLVSDHHAFLIRKEEMKSRVWNWDSEYYPLIIGKDQDANWTFWIMRPSWNGWGIFKEGYLHNVIGKIESGDLYDLDNWGFKWRSFYKELKTDHPKIFKEALKRPIINK